MNSHPRFLPLAIWLLVSLAFPLQTFCADSARKTAGKAPATKQKVELDMAILNDLDKSGVTMTEVPGKAPDKLGKLEIPFLGFVSVYSRSYILQAKELGFTDQRWTLHWTRDGHFLGADFRRPGFIPYKPPHRPTYRAYDEAAYRARSYCIVGISKAPVQINFSTFLKEAADHADPNVPFNQIRIRHILLKMDMEYGESSTAETFTMRMYAKGIMQTVSGRGSADADGVAFDKNGKLLFGDNGL